MDFAARLIAIIAEMMNQEFDLYLSCQNSSPASVVTHGREADDQAITPQ
jgi:hypothetical protein